MIINFFFLLTGTKGHAYTLITEKDKEFAPLLVRNLEGANQNVPTSLLELAEKVRLLINFCVNVLFN